MKIYLNFYYFDFYIKSLYLTKKYNNSAFLEKWLINSVLWRISFAPTSHMDVRTRKRWKTLVLFALIQAMLSKQFMTDIYDMTLLVLAFKEYLFFLY